MFMLKNLKIEGKRSNVYVVIAKSNKRSKANWFILKLNNIEANFRLFLKRKAKNESV
jgi:protease II